MQYLSAFEFANFWHFMANLVGKINSIVNDNIVFEPKS